MCHLRPERRRQTAAHAVVVIDPGECPPAVPCATEEDIRTTATTYCGPRATRNLVQCPGALLQAPDSVAVVRVRCVEVVHEPDALALVELQTEGGRAAIIEESGEGGFTVVQVNNACFPGSGTDELSFASVQTYHRRRRPRILTGPGSR